MSFSKQIKGYTNAYEKRLRFVAREATQETLAESVVVTKKGGRMRVDTGFLRASMQASTVAMPSGPTKNEDGTNYGDGERDGLPSKQVAGEDVSVSLLRWDPNKGDTMHVGFTAEYARPREYRDGFLRGAVQNWSVHVDNAAKKAMQIK